MPAFLFLRSAAVLAVTGLTLPVAAIAQDAGEPASKTEAMQIGQRDGGTTAGEATRRVFLEEAPAPRTRASLMQADGDQIGEPDSNGNAPQQLTSSGESARRMPQLSEAELEATLAQLTPAERSVLLQAIEGTDICDNPPAVAAVVALCRSRLETRSDEFAAKPEGPLTSEERLLRGGVESNGLPTVEAVISRLSRVNVASSDDFNNQAIASIALAPPPATEKPGKEDDPAGLGLGTETEALINAIVQQLGGPPGGGRP
ncbi:MAG: hypothetical protein O9266_04490 [Porphyrobacter sp.]|jgi:hypothetical protein|nr:hypothetical protein [Porphyrobacter sp.]